MVIDSLHLSLCHTNIFVRILTKTFLKNPNPSVAKVLQKEFFKFCDENNWKVLKETSNSFSVEGNESEDVAEF